MENMVIICSDRHFPHGDAGGNRIEYMAMSLIAKGYQPFVISMGENNETEFSPDQSVYKYRNILYKNISAEKKKNTFQQYLNTGKAAAGIIKELDFLPKRIPIIVYTSNPLFDAGLKHENKKLSGKYKFYYFYDVVEWFDSSCYRFGSVNPRYWVFQYCFNKTYCSGNGVIAISRKIQNHFISKKQKAIYYPICLDAQLFAGEANRQRDVVKFIYSGNPKHRECIDVVIETLSLLTDAEKKHIEFHFTGVSKKMIIQLLGKKAYLLDQLNDIVVFHKWMSYSELMNLYHSVDALLMVRKNNHVTESNFPSKVPELLSCGVIVIGNRSGDYFDFLTNGKDAVEIKDKTVAATLSSVREYLNLSYDERCQMSQNAIACANTKFSYLAFSDELVSILERIDEA